MQDTKQEGGNAASHSDNSVRSSLYVFISPLCVL